MKYDVIISGAGPAGVSAALTLGSLGARVAVLEKHTFPRDKVCGDALSGKVMHELGKISPDLSQKLRNSGTKYAIGGVRFVAPSGQALDIPYPSYDAENDSQAPGFIYTRFLFDAFLAECLETYPQVTLKQGQTVQKISSTNAYISVHTSAEELQAPLLIGADGAHSMVKSAFNGQRLRKKEMYAGVRTYFEGVEGWEQNRFIELHFLETLLPGYLWIFPGADNRANVGLGVRSDHVGKRKLHLRSLLTELLNQPPFAHRFKHAKQVGEIKGMGLPLGMRKRPISGERYMLVGDAASLIDPFTGEGIGNAILSGRKAGLHAWDCLEKGDFSPEKLKLYDQDVYRSLGEELRLSTMLHRLVSAPWLFNRVAGIISGNPRLIAAMGSMYEDIAARKQLLSPEFYWKLFFGRSD